MEDLLRYIIISIGFLYALYRVKSVIWDKKYGCETCSLKQTCSKKSCNIQLSNKEKEKIKSIKSIYN